MGAAPRRLSSFGCAASLNPHGTTRRCHRARLSPVDDLAADGGEVALEALLYRGHVDFHEIPGAVGVSGQDGVGDRLVLIEEVEATAVRRHQCLCHALVIELAERATEEVQHPIAG